jgi:uncharacterized protein YjiS (DUF1127 family)
LLKRYWRSYQQRRRQHWLRATLRDLTERELTDIGVMRADIDFLAAERALDRLRDDTRYLWMRSRGVM